MTTGHLDATRLAEHAEGLLAPDEAVVVNAHLQQCETCQATAADLASLSGMLAAAPATLPTPEHVVARIDRAIMAERAPEREPAPVVELSWFRRRAPQLLAAAATVGVLGFAGWLAATGGAGDDAGEATDAGAGVAVPESSDQDAGDPADRGIEADDGPDTADEEAAAPLQAEGEQAAPELADEIRAVVEQARTATGGADNTCGRLLADDVGLDLVGTATTEFTGETAVLVVVQGDDPALAYGWVVPACDATVDEALTQLPVELD
jgi:hypothetical protein